jgi:hypothetical protein
MVLQMWNMMQDRDLFQHTKPNGRYSPAAHLGEMIALIGPPPVDMLKRVDEMRRWSFTTAFRGPDGKMCKKVQDYFGGPFFSDEGEFLQPDLIPTDLKLEDTVTAIEGDPKKEFLRFVRQMLKWRPEERKTAKELADDPWLPALKTQ